MLTSVLRRVVFFTYAVLVRRSAAAEVKWEGRRWWTASSWSSPVWSHHAWIWLRWTLSQSVAFNLRTSAWDCLPLNSPSGHTTPEYFIRRSHFKKIKEMLSCQLLPLFGARQVVIELISACSGSAQLSLMALSADWHLVFSQTHLSFISSYCVFITRVLI